MTNSEAVEFLKDFLEDYEKYNRFIQEGFRLKGMAALDPERHAAGRAMRDRIDKRTLPAKALLSAAGVSSMDFPADKAADTPFVNSLRTTFLRAIGAYEHRLVTLTPPAVTPPAPPEPPAREVQAAPAAAPPPRLGLKERIENHPLWWAGGILLAGFVAGFAAGLFVRDGFDAAVSRRASTVGATKPLSSPSADAALRPVPPQAPSVPAQAQ